MSSAVMLAALLLCGVKPAQADDQDHAYPRAGIELGGRAMYFHSNDETQRNWYGGAQLRWHFDERIAVEGSADYRRAHFGSGTNSDIYPVLGSLLLYLTREQRVSPFLLGGYGWYNTHTTGPNGFSSTQNRHGPHLGAGVQGYFDNRWSMDATWRYVWASSINAPANPNHEHFTGEGWMATAGINYHF